MYTLMNEDSNLSVNRLPGAVSSGVSIEESEAEAEAETESASPSTSTPISKSGRVFVWGSNADGQLGLGNAHETVPFPQQLPFSHQVVHISCGYYHTAMVTAEGELYTCGEGEHGKLGLPDSVAGASTPSRVLLGEPLTAIACGGTHTLALARSGKVFAFGNNSHGQLGLGSEVNQSILPTPVDSLADYNVASVSCGENHSTFITEEGDLYVCGEGRYGKLCNDDIEEKTITIPSRAQKFVDYKVQKAACGGCHSMILAHLFEEKSERQRDHSQTLSPLFMDEERKYSRMSQLSPAVVVNKNSAQSECGDETSTRVERGSIQSIDMNGNEDALSATAADQDSLSNETERLDNDFQEDMKDDDEIEELLADKDDNEEDEKDNDDVAVEPEEKKQGRVARLLSAFPAQEARVGVAASGRRGGGGGGRRGDEAKSRSQSGQSNIRDATGEKKSKACILL
ncbi:Probable E3 ubiquitin-protein ligase HERC2 [Gryllus bimaculatus]|nr:Probable E3 ubiquitin-protein ligase HERC2 [Gryllus bimaculatus]